MSLQNGTMFMRLLLVHCLEERLVLGQAQRRADIGELHEALIHLAVGFHQRHTLIDLGRGALAGGNACVGMKSRLSR